MAGGAIATLLLAACGTADPSSSASEAAAGGATTSPAASFESSGAAPSAPAGPCTPPELCGAELTPGEYAATSGTTEMTFTVGEGWIGTQYGDLGFDLVTGTEEALQIVSAAPYAGVVYTDVCTGMETEEIGATAADFVGHIMGRPGITPRGDATEVTVGGRTGLQLDVDAGDPGCVSDPPSRLWLWDLNGVTDFHLNVGEAARLVALDGDAGVIVLVIETFDPSTFDALLEMAQPVLDSMAFE
jgi:hypothetical protein